MSAHDVRALLRTPYEIVAEAHRLAPLGFTVIVCCTSSLEARSLRRFFASAGYSPPVLFVAADTDPAPDVQPDEPTTVLHASFPESDGAAVASFERRSLLISTGSYDPVLATVERGISEISEFLGYRPDSTPGQ